MSSSLIKKPVSFFWKGFTSFTKDQSNNNNSNTGGKSTTTTPPPPPPLLPSPYPPPLPSSPPPPIPPLDSPSLVPFASDPTLQDFPLLSSAVDSCSPAELAVVSGLRCGTRFPTLPTSRPPTPPLQVTKYGRGEVVPSSSRRFVGWDNCCCCYCNTSNSNSSLDGRFKSFSNSCSNSNKGSSSSSSSSNNTCNNDKIHDSYNSCYSSMEYYNNIDMNRCDGSQSTINPYRSYYKHSPSALCFPDCHSPPKIASSSADAPPPLSLPPPSIRPSLTNASSTISYRPSFSLPLSPPSLSFPPFIAASTSPISPFFYSTSSGTCDSPFLSVPYLLSELRYRLAKKRMVLRPNDFRLGRTVGTGSFGRVRTAEVHPEVLDEIFSDLTIPCFQEAEEARRKGKRDHKRDTTDQEREFKWKHTLKSMHSDASSVRSLASMNTIHSLRSTTTLPELPELYCGTKEGEPTDSGSQEITREEEEVSNCDNSGSNNNCGSYNNSSKNINCGSNFNRSSNNGKSSSFSTWPVLPLALKILRKSKIIKLKQVDHIQDEKRILSAIHHPFIVSLLTTFQDRDRLYMVLEFVNGGELFSYLRKNGRISTCQARFYSAELITAFDYLHYHNIVYRDLKPENLLIDNFGHIKLADFGFAKYIPPGMRTYTLCGTHEYLAPETIVRKGHGRAVDWWALGILIFEMIQGHPPFYGDTPLGIYKQILDGKFEFSDPFCNSGKSLIRRLLHPNPSRRLGCLRNGSKDVMNHRFFREIDWQLCVQRGLTPRFLPMVKDSMDTGMFDEYPETIESPMPFRRDDPTQGQCSMYFTDF